jgi:hypothetical protein
LDTASGVSTDAISHIVNGVVRAKRGSGRGPTRATLTKLVVALTARFDDLVTDKDTRLSQGLRQDSESLVAESQWVG